MTNVSPSRAYFQLSLMVRSTIAIGCVAGTGFSKIGMLGKSMIRNWKIVAILLAACLTLALVRLFLMGKLVEVFVRIVEALGRLGRT